MNSRLSVLALTLALAGAACGYKPVKEGASTRKQAPVTFPHSTHVDADVACATCHDMSKATKLDPAVRHVKIPANVTKQKVCGDCHDTEPKLKKAPAREAVYRITFDHADHLTRVQDCKQCHVKLPEAGDAAMPPPPPMATCTSCHHHQQEFAQARCTPCHVDLKGYKPESAFKHEGNWLAAHGSLARPSAESCAACHDQTYCASCHSPATTAARLETIFPERVDRAFIHRGDYVARHMVDAGANPASCRSCHGSPFCDSCHTANGFTKGTTGTPIRPLTHGSGWVGGLNRHASEARRDISTCAACHDNRGPDNTCVGCHRTSAKSPHPPGFKLSRSDIAKNSMCKVCH